MGAIQSSRASILFMPPEERDLAYLYDMLEAAQKEENRI